MRDKELEKTQKALEELVKVEYMAIAAYDEAIGETEDGRLRKQYTRFRNDHEKQARDLNNRLVELGGEPLEYGVGSGKVKAGLWGKITGLFGDAASIGGMVTGAEDGIRIYLNHLDEIHDSKALSVVRRNLESKQQEVRWLEEQAAKAKDQGGQDTGKKVRQTADELMKKEAQMVKAAKSKVEEATQPKAKTTGILSLPMLLLLAAGAAAAFFFLRRQEEPDFSDEAFEYETTDFGTSSDTSSTAGEGYHGINEGANNQTYGSENNS